MPNDTIMEVIAGLVEKLALELAFASPGKDTGLLPINNFVMGMEDRVIGRQAPPEIQAAVTQARAWLDRLFETTVQFDQDAIACFGEWHGWMKPALEKWRQGLPLPAIPAHWKSAAEKASATSPNPSPAARSAVPSQTEVIVGLVEKLALELAFVAPGKDTGLLPINNFVMDMEARIAGGAAPAEIKAAVAQARSWLNRLFDTTVQFDQEAITSFGAWHGWMQPALEKWQHGQPLPPIPVHWEAAARTAATPAAPAAPAPAPSSTAQAAASSPAAAAPAGEPTITLNLESDSELLRDFSGEANEHLQNIEQGVLVLEENPKDADTLNSIFRAFHTFKGGAGFLNLGAIKNLAHELESLLDAARQHKLEVNTEIIEVILAGGDTLKQFMAEIVAQVGGNNAGQPIQVPTLSLIARVNGILGKNAGAPSAAAHPAPTTAAAAILPSPAPVILAAPAASPNAPSPEPISKTAAPEPPKTQTPAAAASSGFVKVDTHKLDSLIDQVGELVIAQSMVVQDPNVSTIASQTLSRNIAQLRRITNELQRTSMSLRMVPIRGAFQKMTRLVRDTAAKQAKQVRLVLSGEDTEMDRNIVEEISDPLIHMIRNSVDHGIESVQDRQARGKPLEGTIHLRAFHQGGSIVIQIEDDGAGLNKERILAKAIEKGMVKPGETPPEKEIFGLIFAAGFSTAAVITEISGRGVGMDVVRRNIDKLRGKVDIDSVLGKGSTFTIYLPLTLAIIDGLIVSTGLQRYVLPTLSVRESFRPTAAMLSSVYERGEMVNVRGRLTPIVRLHRLFDVTPKTTDPTKAIFMVIESGTETRCLMVDELIGKQEVVIKSLGEQFKHNRALAGAAILGDGKVGLILDVDSLVKPKPETTATSLAQ